MANNQQNTKRWALPALAAIALTAVWLVFWPPRWWLNATKSVDLTSPVKTGRMLVKKYECMGCHQSGGRVPSLAGVSDRLDSKTIRIWLRDPGAIPSRTDMPDFKLSDSEIEAIMAYLAVMGRPRG